MNLVLIQGNLWAQYTGRTQGPIVEFDPVVFADFDIREVLEDFRVNEQGTPNQEAA